MSVNTCMQPHLIFSIRPDGVSSTAKRNCSDRCIFRACHLACDTELWPVFVTPPGVAVTSGISQSCLLYERSEHRKNPWQLHCTSELGKVALFE